MSTQYAVGRAISRRLKPTVSIPPSGLVTKVIRIAVIFTFVLGGLSLASWLIGLRVVV